MYREIMYYIIDTRICFHLFISCLTNITLSSYLLKVWINSSVSIKKMFVPNFHNILPNNFITKQPLLTKSINVFMFVKIT